MCLNPVRVLNKGVITDLAHYKRLYNYVPCGHCLECREQYDLSWQVRSTYHALATFDSGLDSYIYYDTLTYDEDHLPRVNLVLPGIEWTGLNDRQPCFSREHLRKFFMRLRRKLEYAGYDVRNNLDYFVGCEYGDHNTKRSHYHILLYVKFSVDPLVLSRFVSDCWKFGRTDGVPFKSEMYVRQHNVLTSNHFIDAVQYVSKYVRKTYHYTKRLTTLVYDYYLIKHDADFMDSYVLRKRYLRDLRLILPFHLQSKNFGASALDNVEYIDEQNCYVLPLKTKNGIIRVGLSPYIKRKKFQHQIWLNGERRWVYNDSYVDDKIRNIDKDIKNDYVRLSNELVRFKHYYGYNDKFEGFIECLKLINIRDYLIYKRYYDGRVISSLNPTIVDLLDNDKVHQSLDQLRAFGLPVIYNYHDGRYKIKHWSLDYHGDIKYGTHKSLYKPSFKPSVFTNPLFDELIKSEQWIVAANNIVGVNRRHDAYLFRESLKSRGILNVK